MDYSLLKAGHRAVRLPISHASAKICTYKRSVAITGRAENQVDGK